MPFIMVTVLIDMLAIGLIIPVLPALVGSFSHSQADQAYWYGVVAFAFGIASFFASPVLGALSDRYGRRPVLLLGFFGLGLNFFLTAFATQIGILPLTGTTDAEHMKEDLGVWDFELSADEIQMVYSAH